MSSFLHTFVLVCGWLLLLSIDLLNLSLNIRRNIKGDAPSPIYVVPIVLYLMVCFLTRDEGILFPVTPTVLAKALDFTSLLAFHVMCNWVLPFLHRRLTGRH